MPEGPGIATPLLKPNIVFFLTDDQTFESLGHMSYLNANSWIRFDNAWIENALCCPSRATIMQGRYDTRTGVGNNKQGWRFNPSETEAVWLQRQGYNTALIGKYLNGVSTATTPAPGWNDWEVVLPTPYMYQQYGYTLNDNGTSVVYGNAPGDYEVNVLTDRAKRYIASQAGLGSPFFLFFAPTATHGPWRASPTRTSMFNSTPVPLTPDVNEADVSDKPAWIQALTPTAVTTINNQRRREWAAGVSVDDALAALDAQLQASGVADNTVVVFMTDNGYSFAQHRYYGKMCEYAVCSRTPLLVRYPGVPSHTVSQLVSNVDIASTLADIGGATPGISQDGQSPLPLILGTPVTSWRDAVLQHWTGGDNVGGTGHGTAIPAFWAVRSAMNGHNFAYVEVSTGEKELYDETADPYDLNNVAGLPQYAAEEASLAGKLAALKAQATPSSTTPPFYRTGVAPPNLQIAPDD